jgi:hypothetical protein
MIDTIHMLDASSWVMLEQVCNECKRLAIVMMMQTDNKDDVRVADSA